MVLRGLIRKFNYAGNSARSFTIQNSNFGIRGFLIGKQICSQYDPIKLLNLFISVHRPIKLNSPTNKIKILIVCLRLNGFDINIYKYLYIWKIDFILIE